MIETQRQNDNFPSGYFLKLFKINKVRPEEANKRPKQRLSGEKR